MERFTDEDEIMFFVLGGHMYKLETENFLLELLPGIHQDNFPYPKANHLRVKVSSNFFCGFYYGY